MASMLIGACFSQIPSSTPFHRHASFPFPSRFGFESVLPIIISSTSQSRVLGGNHVLRRADKEQLFISASGEDEGNVTTASVSKKRYKVVVRPSKNPRLVLKFLWLEKNIGIGLDQVVPGHGTVPLSPFYFWPRKDAWEELKIKLESKPWVTQKYTIILLNQATDIINLWQQSASSNQDLVVRQPI